ncbi:hypothetical protein [Roseinatronobacter thiooxidans]|nr:hypothetical protein [Roseinatronobacter thiooxidans]
MQMFQFLSDDSAQHGDDPAFSLLSRGKFKEMPAAARVNSRIDTLSASLGARLPERGYFKH